MTPEQIPEYAQHVRNISTLRWALIIKNDGYSPTSGEEAQTVRRVFYWLLNKCPYCHFFHPDESESGRHCQLCPLDYHCNQGCKLITSDYKLWNALPSVATAFPIYKNLVEMPDVVLQEALERVNAQTSLDIQDKQKLLIDMTLQNIYQYFPHNIRKEIYLEAHRKLEQEGLRVDCPIW